MLPKGSASFFMFLFAFVTLHRSSRHTSEDAAGIRQDAPYVHSILLFFTLTVRGFSDVRFT